MQRNVSANTDRNDFIPFGRYGEHHRYSIGSGSKSTIATAAYTSGVSAIRVAQRSPALRLIASAMGGEMR